MFGYKHVEFITDEVLKQRSVPMRRIAEKMYATKSSEYEGDGWGTEEYRGVFRSTEGAFVLTVMHIDARTTFDATLELVTKDVAFTLLCRPYYGAEAWSLNDYKDENNMAINNFMLFLLNILEDGYMLTGGDPFLDEGEGKNA